MTWITDERGNRASVEYWGSEEKARKSLASNKETVRNCDNCSDCSGCYDCYGCSDCSRCSGCYDCSRCSDCYGCYGCSDCSRCSGCSGCYDCYGCSDCYDLQNSAPSKAEPASVPVIENIHSKLLAAVTSNGNQLQMETWHSCETTHCRAGWVVHLAGEAGYALEKRTSCLFAAMQIYKASGYEISPVRFFDDNEVAMADIKRLGVGD